MIWLQARRVSRGINTRRLCTTTRRRFIKDEGDWFYSSEWWGTYDNSDSRGHTVFRCVSDKGNGVVSVVAYPSSRPNPNQWQETEKWLARRYAELHPGDECKEQFKILGYEWRVLRFNDDTRQSTVKVMAASRDSKAGSVYLMQQAHCLAAPYLKSMVSAGLATIACCDYDLIQAALGKKTMRILCIGHGGGSVPLFLARKIQGAVIHIVDVDPLVISASTQVMGFPDFSRISSSGQRALSKATIIDDVLWKGIQERLYLFESDAEKFILETSIVYDMVFVDAYDGDDIFPHKLWDPDSPFLNALSRRLHPEHGTVVVNLHSGFDADVPSHSPSYFGELVLPTSPYVNKVCRAYKDVLVGKGNYFLGWTESSGVGFTVSVPWVCNTSLVVCRGFKMKSRNSDRDSILSTIISKSFEVENAINLPFSCFEFIKRGFTLVD